MAFGSFRAPPVPLYKTNQIKESSTTHNKQTRSQPPHPLPLPLPFYEQSNAKQVYACSAAADIIVTAMIYACSTAAYMPGTAAAAAADIIATQTELRGSRSQGIGVRRETIDNGQMWRRFRPRHHGRCHRFP